jgi:hypothetical protein
MEPSTSLFAVWLAHAGALAPVAPTPASAPRVIDGAVRVELGGQFLRALPGATATFGGALALRTRRARVELRGRWATPRRTFAREHPDAGVQVDLWTLGASGCYAPRWRRLEFPICAGLEFGAMRGRGFGVTQPRSARMLYVAVPVDANLVWAPIPRVGLLVGAGASPAVVRPSYGLEAAGPLFRAGPVALRVVVGVEVRFP